MNQIFVAVWEEWDSNKVLCGAKSAIKCTKFAEEICKKEKRDIDYVEIIEIPFDNTNANMSK